MSYIMKYRWYLVGLLALIIVVAYAVHRYEVTRPGPITTDTSMFTSGNFTFSYDRTYVAKEYASGVVSVGENYQKAGFIPLAEVVRYKADPDVAAPVSFDAFMKKQVGQLCGSDNSALSITCTNPVVTQYTTGVTKGEMVMLTLTKKNLTTGTSSSSTYGPIYVFNSTPAPVAGEATRYQGVFVYPTFSSFILVGTTSPAFIQSIADTVKLN